MSARPTAAKGTFPYRHHRTMAEVLRDEELDEWNRLPSEVRRGRTIDSFREPQW